MNITGVTGLTEALESYAQSFRGGGRWGVGMRAIA
jgi:hypothetical protein